MANIDNAGGDATLKFEKTLNKKVIKAGDAFEFKGVVDSFTPDPYMLTLTIDDPKEMIKGYRRQSVRGSSGKEGPHQKEEVASAFCRAPPLSRPTGGAHLQRASLPLRLLSYW